MLSANSWTWFHGFWNLAACAWNPAVLDFSNYIAFGFIENLSPLLIRLGWRQTRKAKNFVLPVKAEYLPTLSLSKWGIIFRISVAWNQARQWHHFDVTHWLSGTIRAALGRKLRWMLVHIDVLSSRSFLFTPETNECDDDVSGNDTVRRISSAFTCWCSCTRFPSDSGSGIVLDSRDRFKQWSRALVSVHHNQSVAEKASNNIDI